MIDTHAHLTSEQFEKDLDEVIQRARNSGLTNIFSQSTSYLDLTKNIDIAMKYKGFVKVGIGLHPEDIAKIYLESISYEESVLKIEDELKKSKEIYDKSDKNIFSHIGEIGLDYFMFNRDEKLKNLAKDKLLELLELQKVALSKYLDLSVESDMPVVIHSRELKNTSDKNLDFYNFSSNRCLEDILEIINTLEEKRGAKIKIVFHCFSYDDYSIAEEILKRGYFISFTNIVSYPKSEKLALVSKQVIKNYPNKVMFETDAPYLPPVDKRGKRCEPSDVNSVYDFFKEDATEELINQNVNNFFNQR